MTSGGEGEKSLFRRALAAMHPEGIPWPASFFYNLLSGTGVFQRHYDLVAEDIRSCSLGSSVLDVGTGPGWLLVKLHRLCPAARLVGVDISPAMVSRARENLRKSGCADAVELREAGAQSLPFADGSFDTVVSTGSLHHWKDPVAGLDEVYRVLRAGGLGLIYDLVTRMPGEVRLQATEQFGRLRMTLLWLHSFEEPFHTAESLASMAASTKFGTGHTRFVGALCCLVLRKGS